MADKKISFIESTWRDIKNSVDKVILTEDTGKIKYMLKNTEDNLEKLRIMTNNLSEIPNFSEFVRSNNNSVEFNVESGAALAEGLFSNENISVANCVFEEGTVFELHNHEEREWLIVYSGKLKIDIKDKIIELEHGQSLMIDPFIPHKGETEVKTEFIAITIPKGKGFPDARA